MNLQKKTAKLDCANIKYNEHGTPVAGDFDDVYFSNQDGLAESRYVFIEQNRLNQRWHAHNENTFVIAETGFGTGLNFLAVWQAFLKFRRDFPNAKLTHLHVISTEKYPLSHADLTMALAHWPQLKPFSDPLLAQYPQPLLGCHRRHFANSTVTLDLWLGDIAESLPQMSQRYQGVVDAWFLDGFAPSKNPQMWQPDLYANMARLSKLGGSFATFTAAGTVKRGLTEVGFEIKKVKGFGHKREMLIGELRCPSSTARTDTLYYRSEAHFSNQAKNVEKVVIIGAGLAGTHLAYSFSRRGYETLLIGSQEQLADGASGNHQGGFYPQLNAESNIASEIQALAFDYACNHYRDLLSQGYDFAHQWCGVLQLAFNQTVAQRQQKLIENGCWPASMIHGISAEQSSVIAGIDLPMPALFIPEGGWINPPQLVQALCQAAKDLGKFELQLDCPVEDITTKGDGYQLRSGKRHFDADIVIVAAGADASNFDQCKGIPFQAVRGQVEHIPSQSPLSGLKTVLCHKGYLTPQFEGMHALGSTYVKQDRTTEYRLSEQAINQNTIQKALSRCDWAQQLSFKQQGRAAARCSVPDHLPVVGNLFSVDTQQKQFSDLYKALPVHRYPQAQWLPNLYVLSGLGSRGLTTAPLMAELLFSQIVGDPLPLSQTLLDALSPNRFLIRQLIRRQ